MRGPARRLGAWAGRGPIALVALALVLGLAATTSVLASGPGPRTDRVLAPGPQDDASVLSSIMNQGGASVTASPPSIRAGGIETATWSGISSPQGGDWIGLYPVGVPDSDRRYGWIFTGGTASGSGGYQLPSDLPTGSYELRLFANYGWTRLAVSNTFTLPTLSAAPLSNVAAGVATATWSGITGPTGGDWIGLYPVGVPDSDRRYGWIYTGGTASGNGGYQLPANLPGGVYELRLFANGSWLRLGVSNAFTVVTTLTVSPPSLAPGGVVTANWSGIPSATASDWIGLYPVGADDTDLRYSFVNTDGSTAGQTGYQLPPDLPVGTYELRLFANGSWLRLAASNPFTLPTLTVSGTSVHAGDTVTVSWSGLANPSSTDWVGFFPAGAVDGTAPLGWRYTDGTANNAAGFLVPPADLAGQPLRAGYL